MNLFLNMESFNVMRSNIESTLEVDVENHGNDNASPNKKSCRALSLSCWVALLTFLILVFQNIFTLLKELSANERFWETANQYMSMMEKYNESVLSTLKDNK